MNYFNKFQGALLPVRRASEDSACEASERSTTSFPHGSRGALPTPTTLPELPDLEGCYLGREQERREETGTSWAHSNTGRLTWLQSTLAKCESMCAARCNLRRQLEDAAVGAGVLQEVVVTGGQLQRDQSSDMLLDGVTPQPVSPKLCPSSIEYPAEGKAEDTEYQVPSPLHVGNDEWWPASRIVEYVMNAMQRVMVETDARVEYQVKTVLAKRFGERLGWEQAVEQELMEHRNQITKLQELVLERDSFLVDLLRQQREQQAMLSSQAGSLPEQPHPMRNTGQTDLSGDLPPEYLEEDCVQVDGHTCRLSSPTTEVWQDQVPTWPMIQAPGTAGPTTADAAVRTLNMGSAGRSKQEGQPHQPFMAANFSPALFSLQQAVEAPWLDPMKKDGFGVFARQWEEWSKWQFVGLPGGSLGDNMRRDLLLTRLHPSIRAKFKEEIQRNPVLKFSQVWEELRLQYGVDNPHYWRTQWEAVKLRVESNEVCLADWLLFRSRYEAAKAKVSDYTDTEAAELVLRQLPNLWVERALTAEAKDSRNKTTARFDNLDMPPQTLQRLLERLVGPVRAIRKLKGAMEVDFNNKEQLSKLTQES